MSIIFVRHVLMNTVQFPIFQLTHTVVYFAICMYTVFDRLNTPGVGSLYGQIQYTHATSHSFIY